MMDDILVVGKDKKQHVRRLSLVLVRLETAGLPNYKEKCEFGVSEVRFLQRFKQGKHPSKPSKGESDFRYGSTKGSQESEEISSYG